MVFFLAILLIDNPIRLMIHGTDRKVILVTAYL